MKWRFSLAALPLALLSVAAWGQALPLPPMAAAPSGLYTSCGDPQGGQFWIGMRDGKTVEQDVRFNPSSKWSVLVGTRVLSDAELARLNEEWWAAGNVMWAAASDGGILTLMFAPGTRPEGLHMNTVRPSIVVRQRSLNVDYCTASSLPAAATATAQRG